jgi:hypothetical protein
MTGSWTIAVFHVIDGVTNGKPTNTLTVTVEDLGDDDPGTRQGLGRFVVRGTDGTIDERFPNALDAVRQGLDLAGWWHPKPTQI